MSPPTEPTCISCGEPVSMRDPSVLREVTGWSRPREKGGQNHVLFRVETGRFMCNVCAKRKAGGSEQESLL